MYALNSVNNYDFQSSFSDPRLISAAHSGHRMLLDAPVRNGDVPMKDVYSHRPGYSMNYADYSDIGGGDIIYYYDIDIGVPFIKPLFDPSPVSKSEYIDPMGTYKPHYYRDPNKVCGRGLTWLQDSQYQRDDIIARQIWKRNQSDPLYAHS